MLDQTELMYLLETVENSKVGTTSQARNKAIMTMKLCDLIDEEEAKKIKKPPPKPTARGRKKKVAKKK